MSQIDSNCIFCNKSNCKIIKENKYFFVIRDTAYPVTKHHTLIISNRHIDDYFKLTTKELNELSQILKEQKAQLNSLDETISGFNIVGDIGDVQTNFNDKPYIDVVMDSVRIVSNQTNTDFILLNKDPRLIKIVDILGRESNPNLNIPLIYTYENGDVEKVLRK